jgi:hypothetical protein
VTVYSTLSNTYASNLGTMSTQNANAVASYRGHNHRAVVSLANRLWWHGR